MYGKLSLFEPVPAVGIASNQGTDPNPSVLITSLDPKEAWTAANINNRTLILDFGAAVTLDSVLVGYFTGVGSIRVYTASDAGGSFSANAVNTVVGRPADCATVRANFYRRFDPLTSRYWVVALTANTAPPQIGVLAMGLAFEPSYDREWGSGRRPIDTGKATALLGGGFALQDGVRKAAFSWTLGDLTDAEVAALWNIFLRKGGTKPLVVAERDNETIGQSEQVHYGLLTGFEQYERRAPAETKWSMTLEEWV